MSCRTFSLTKTEFPPFTKENGCLHVTEFEIYILGLRKTIPKY